MKERLKNILRFSGKLFRNKSFRLPLFAIIFIIVFVVGYYTSYNYLYDSNQLSDTEIDAISDSVYDLYYCQSDNASEAISPLYSKYGDATSIEFLSPVKVQVRIVPLDIRELSKLIIIDFTNKENPVVNQELVLIELILTPLIISLLPIAIIVFIFRVIAIWINKTIITEWHEYKELSIEEKSNADNDK